METLFVSLAYKYVALALMLAEANHAIDRLEVPGWSAVSVADVLSYHISPPRLRPGGSVDTRKIMFGFGSEGKLQFIHAYQPEHALSVEERHRRWAEMKSLISTNEAIQLATNWLTRLDIDVEALDKAQPRHVLQEFYYRGGEPVPEKLVLLPRFEVWWGTNQATAAVGVSIFGPTKEPLFIRQNDISFSKRPRGLVRDAERLLKIPDTEFARYSLLEKSNLVVVSAVAGYPAYSLPDVVRAQSTNTVTNTSPRKSPGTPKDMRLPRPRTRTVPPSSEAKTNQSE